MRRHYSLFCISLLPEQLQKHMIANFLHVLSFFINIFIKIFPCELLHTHFSFIFFILISWKAFESIKRKEWKNYKKARLSKNLAINLALREGL